MARKGKSFELLVKKLESILIPKGAIIQSPDYIDDKVIDTKREVDITIKNSHEFCSAITVIECRDRKQVEDLLWIEQLITKNRDTNVNRTIAVSTSGFSKNAATKAAHYGIELKIYREITNEDVQRWFTLDAITICEQRTAIESAIIDLGDIKPLQPSPLPSG